MGIIRRSPAAQGPGHVLEERAITVTAFVTSIVPARPAASATQVAGGITPASIVQSNEVKSPTSTSTFFVTVTPSKSTDAVSATTTKPSVATTSSSTSSSTTSTSTSISLSTTASSTGTSTSTTSTSSSSFETAVQTSTRPVIAPSASASPATSSATAGANTDMTSGSLSAVHRSSVPPGVIGAIIAVVVVCVLAVGFFFVRRRNINKRQMRRKTWGAGMVNDPDFSITEKKYEQARLAQRAPSIRDNRDSRDAHELPNPHSPAPNTYAAAASMAAPAMSYNNSFPPTYGLAPPSVRLPVTQAGAAALASAAIVRCTFIPSLPDELPITTGETVRILGEYDDGWALCVNGRGEQGMVPLECLDKSFGGRMGVRPPPSMGDWRASKRVSSLASRYGNRI